MKKKKKPLILENKDDSQSFDWFTNWLNEWTGEKWRIEKFKSPVKFKALKKTNTNTK